MKVVGAVAQLVWELAAHHIPAAEGSYSWLDSDTLESKKEKKEKRDIAQRQDAAALRTWRSQRLSGSSSSTWSPFCRLI